MTMASLVGFRWFEWRSRRDFHLRLSWAEISGGWGLALALCMFDEHFSLHVRLGWPNIFIRLPFLQHWHRDPYEMMESWGASMSDASSIHFNWGRHCKIVHLPWAWEWVRTSYLLPDGVSWLHDLKRKRRAPQGTDSSNRFGKYTAIADAPKWRATYPYRYVLRSGEVQECEATITVEEMEHRWRWFTWLPLPRMIHRSINIEFNEEVGEGAGSWKGGCVGCRYDLRHYETPLECLRRMEGERKFSR